MAKEPTDRMLEGWREAIRERGEKRIKARALLKAFGAERRGDVVSRRIREWFAAQTPPLHPNGLDHIGTLDDSVKISDRVERQLGGLVEREKELGKLFEQQIMPRLGRLRLVEAEYSPEGSRRKFDFLCQADDGTKVIVELKRWGGEQHGVQQLLNYLRSLRDDPLHGKATVRGIFITGIADRETMKVLEELHPDYQLVEWWIYGLDREKRVLLERVTVTPARGSTPRRA